MPNKLPIDPEHQAEFDALQKGKPPLIVENMDSIIADIMQRYPENEWLERCRAALPGVDDGEILSAIEIFSGGDVQAVEG